MDKGVLIGVGVLVVIVIIGAVFFSTNHQAYSSTTTTPGGAATTSIATSGSSGNGNVPVMMTDPAQVPRGTSALVFTYTAVQLNESSAYGSTWVNATGSGSVNLIAIQNRTQVLAYANLAQNTTINQVRLNITSVKITVNNTVYSVPVSKTQVTLSVSGNGQVSSGSGILIDYTPTVSPAFNNNATIFVRVPAAKTTVVSGVSSSFATNVSATAQISASEEASIAAVAPSIQITSASLSAQGNATQLSVTLKNSGNQSVALNTVNIYGAQKVSAAASAAANVNASLASSINSALLGSATSIKASTSALLGVGIGLQSYGMQTFSASSNGSLVLVSGLSTVQSGVVLAPGATATLTFNGTTTYNSGTFQTVPKSGSQYQVNVVGSTGAYTSTVVTAT